MPSVPSPETFEAIESAVKETPRGRWFLTEFASRVRSRETTAILDQIGRLETAVVHNHDEIISRLAKSLVPNAATEPAAMPELALRHMKFFKRDEDIFEPAPQATIAVVKPAPAAEEKRGARLTITRIGPAPEASSGEATLAPKPQPETITAEPAPANPPPSSRIVIVRHKPGQDIELPMQDELAQAG